LNFIPSELYSGLEGRVEVLSPGIFSQSEKDSKRIINCPYCVILRSQSVKYLNW